MPDQVLFQRGDPARQFFVVLEGQVKLCLQSRDGQEKVVDRIVAGIIAVQGGSVDILDVRRLRHWQ